MKVYSKLRKCWCEVPFNGYNPHIDPYHNAVSFKAQTEIDQQLLLKFVDIIDQGYSEKILNILNAINLNTNAKNNEKI